jgi:hypothetical protein
MIGVKKNVSKNSKGQYKMDIPETPATLDTKTEDEDK